MFLQFLGVTKASRRRYAVVHALLLLAALQDGSAFYVPGVAPAEFKAGDIIDVRAVKLTSVHRQLPYDYYSLPLCRPDGPDLQYAPENLGEILRGDRIVNTMYKLNMKMENGCRKACAGIKLTAEQSNELVSRIEFDYHVHLLVDNLPSATRIKSATSAKEFLDHGYSLGYVFGRQVMLNNHLVFKMQYHQYGESYRVVGFEVEAKSIDWRELTFKQDSCAPKTGSFEDIKPLELVRDAENEIIWTYSVQWQQSEIEWASRWDILLGMENAEIHVFSIVNSIIVVLCLSGFLAVIIIRTVRRDIAKYNRDEDMDETLEETGWKLVHGDVFRPPANAKLLVSLVGSGIHIFGMSLIIIVIAMLGMLSPSSRGSLMTSGLFLYCFMGSIAGYYSGRLYKTLRGIQWKRAAFQVATLFPGTIFGTCFVLNFFIWGKHSSGAVPFPTMLALLTMWFGIDVPLVYVGFYFGYRKQPYEHPVRTNQIPRQIPEQPWYLRTLISNMAAGILPFGAMFIELFFIFSAIWENQFYYLFGFLFLVFLIVVISCGLISIVVTYFQLCAESYRWWWRSFFIGGSSAFYVFAYSVFYYYTKLEIIGFIPTLLYLGYSFLIAFAFWLFTGMIGFYASYSFVQKIYGAVKID